MPLIDPDDSDNGSNGSEKSGNSKRRNGDGRQDRVVAEPPENGREDGDMTMAKRTDPIVDNGARPEPPRAVFPAELKEIAESQPQRARQLLRHMEENGEMAELSHRSGSGNNPLMRQPEGGTDPQLRSQVEELQRKVGVLESAVDALVELHDEVPFSAECQECGGNVEFKQPFTGDNRLECEHCGNVEPSGTGS